MGLGYLLGRLLPGFVGGRRGELTEVRRRAGVTAVQVLFLPFPGTNRPPKRNGVRGPGTVQPPPAAAIDSGREIPGRARPVFAAAYLPADPPSTPSARQV